MHAAETRQRMDRRLMRSFFSFHSLALMAGVGKEDDDKMSGDRQEDAQDRRVGWSWKTHADVDCPTEMTEVKLGPPHGKVDRIRTYSS